MTISIRIDGPNAEAIAAEVEPLLAEAFQETPTRKAMPREQATDRADPIAVTALILSIPGVVLATLDLAERAKLAERIERLREKIRARASDKDRIELCVGADPAVDLARTDRDAIMDLLSKHRTARSA